MTICPRWSVRATYGILAETEGILEETNVCQPNAEVHVRRGIVCLVRMYLPQRRGRAMSLRSSQKIRGEHGGEKITSH